MIGSPSSHNAEGKVQQLEEEQKLLIKLRLARIANGYLDVVDGCGNDGHCDVDEEKRSLNTSARTAN